MSSYKVDVAVRPRSMASVSTSDTAANIPVGTIFDSIVSQIDSVTPSHPTMLQISGGVWNGKWIPLVYNNVTYCELIPVVPPSGTPSLTHTIQVYSDGSLIIDGKPYV